VDEVDEKGDGDLVLAISQHSGQKYQEGKGVTPIFCAPEDLGGRLVSELF
jgi:hypothetical protein